MAAEGAYAKAAAGLTSDLMHFTEEEDLKWAKELIPRTERPEGTTFYNAARENHGTDTDHTAADDTEAFESPIKGVHYAKLTGPGPSGTRPDHIQELLATSKAHETNGLLRSLARIHDAIADGTPCWIKWLKFPFKVSVNPSINSFCCIRFL